MLCSNVVSRHFVMNLTFFPPDFGQLGGTMCNPATLYTKIRPLSVHFVLFGPHRNFSFYSGCTSQALPRLGHDQSLGYVRAFGAAAAPIPPVSQFRIRGRRQDRIFQSSYLLLIFRCRACPTGSADYSEIPCSGQQLHIERCISG